MESNFDIHKWQAKFLREEGAFGDTAFADKNDPPQYAQAQGKKPGTEPNTKEEQKLLDALEGWLESSWDGDDSTIVRYKKLMPQLKQEYPQVFQPLKPDGTPVYRGLSSLNDYLEGVVDNSNPSDWKQAGEGWWIYRKPVKPRSTSDLQSYSYSMEKAKQFGENSAILVTKQDSSFFMNSAVYNPLEEEVLHFGRIYSHPVYLIISEYIYEMSVADDDED
jgi:hypothetical protein